jgi:cell division protein FtsW (lipid II flippase)
VGLGVLSYAIFSSIDLEFFSEHRTWLMAFSLALLALLIPFGTDLGSGNKSWLALPLIPVSIQPAEICKISYILIAASVMTSHQHNLSSFRSVVHMGWYLVLLVGTNQQHIEQGVTMLLDNADLYRQMSEANNPYGDGHACERIAAALMQSK